LINNWLETKNK